MCGLAPSRVLASLNYGAGGWEAATVRVLPTGKVQVVTGATPHGQGHETSWSMIVADKLGVVARRRRGAPLRHRHLAARHGHLRLAVAGGRGTAIVLAADKVIDKARAIAAHQLEVAEDDLEFADGTFRVAGSPDKELSIQALAFEAFTAHNLPDGMEPNLQAATSPTTRPTSRSRSAPTSASSRSTRRRARSTCATTSPSTTAGTRSTR